LRQPDRVVSEVSEVSGYQLCSKDGLHCNVSHDDQIIYFCHYFSEFSECARLVSSDGDDRAPGKACGNAYRCEYSGVPPCKKFRFAMYKRLWNLKLRTRADHRYCGSWSQPCIKILRTVNISPHRLVFRTPSFLQATTIFG